jgi:hypothetical protein
MSDLLSRCTVDLLPREIEDIRAAAAVEVNADIVQELQHRFGALLSEAKSARSTAAQLVTQFVIELAIAQLRVHGTLHFRELVAGVLGASSADVCEIALVRLAREVIAERRR